MKFLAKVVLFFLATNYITSTLQNPPKPRIGRRSNYDPSTFVIKNNGGL